MRKKNDESDSTKFMIDTLVRHLHFEHPKRFRDIEWLFLTLKKRHLVTDAEYVKIRDRIA